MIERLAERDDIARWRHGHADAEHVLSLEPHVLGGRIGIAATHDGDIAEPERAPVHANQRLTQRLDVLELPARAHVHPIVGRVIDAGTGYRVLCTDGVRDLLRREIELRELRIRDLDVDALLLIGDEVDLVHIGYAQELGTQPLAIVIELRGLEAVALERINIGVDIAELVIEVRTLDAGRQRGGDVSHLLANLIPGVRHLSWRRGVLDGEEELRLAGPRVRAQEVDVGSLLELTGDAVRYLFLDLPGRGARPECTDHHHLEGEGRILGLREAAVGGDPEQRQQRQDKNHQRLVAKCPGGQIEAMRLTRRERPHGQRIARDFRTHRPMLAARARAVVFSASPRVSSAANRGFTGVTCSPAYTACTPAETILSPSPRPPST